MTNFWLGSPVGGAGGAVFFIRPGKKKVAGETVPPALMPPHPVRNNVPADRIASGSSFQFNLTHSQYKTTGRNGNL